MIVAPDYIGAKVHYDKISITIVGILHNVIFPAIGRLDITLCNLPRHREIGHYIM